MFADTVRVTNVCIIIIIIIIIIIKPAVQLLLSEKFEIFTHT